MKNKPVKPCHVCKSDCWWIRPSGLSSGPGDWVCGFCHPAPLNCTAEASPDKQEVWTQLVKVDIPMDAVPKLPVTAEGLLV